MQKRLKYRAWRSSKGLQALRPRRKAKKKDSRKQSVLEMGSAEDDACFWISLVDFTKRFKWLYVCQLFDPQLWKHKSVQGKWIGQTAGGPPNQPGAEYNPQFALRLAKGGKAATAALFISITNLTSREEAQQRAMELSSCTSDEESVSGWSEDG